MKPLNYISQHFHPSTTLNGGQIGDPVQLINVTKTEYMYRYNEKEWQDELGLNMYAMDMRQYDPAIARWVVQDPVVHHSMSLYSSFDGNPVFWADPSGADTESWINDLFNRSNSGDVWTNDGNGTFTNNRNGETSECDDCPKGDSGPLEGKVLNGYLGRNYSGSSYIPWKGTYTTGTLYEKDEFANRIEDLLNDFEMLENIINYSAMVLEDFQLKSLKI